MKHIFLIICIYAGFGSNAQQAASVFVYFNTDRFDLDLSAKRTLDSLVLAIPAGLTYNLKIGGHCDARGSIGHNQRLSKNRANAVAAYLRQRGITTLSITAIDGFGEDKLLSTESTATGHQMNRRVEIELQLPENGTVTLTDQLKDSSSVVGTNIILPRINFVGGMHQFLPESFPMLEELLTAMRSFPNLVVEVQGHICCQPDEREGMDIETGLYNLSAARAKAVSDYLINKGIDPRRVTSKGFGHAVPLYPFPEKTEEERTANRRVEIKIIRK